MPSRIVFHPRTGVQATAAFIKPWAPSLVLWGASAGSAALLFLSVTPLVKREVLVKVPLLGTYFQDNTPASDKPF